jgi:hypothetical protein
MMMAGLQWSTQLNNKTVTVDDYPWRCMLTKQKGGSSARTLLADGAAEHIWAGWVG